VYKFREDLQRYTEMFLLYMEHYGSEIYDIGDIRRMNYEQIKANRNSILRR
jgi:hypothetical protein